ncbi:hypothetical protein [Vibrio ishigakensis]|uniref:hypothetical protein n=1 Tax=Vibrio ishigakensis TaxID=1481914 RepID=UPI0021C27B29|nr:hypothetical protein [Vibrio ishigakensis]
MIKQTVVLAFSVALVGCAQSLVGAASFAASDLSYSEFNFLRHINYVAGEVAECNRNGELNHNLDMALYRINMDSDTTILQDSLLAQAFSMGTCQEWSNKLLLWEQTGELGLIGGSAVDPKWIEFRELIPDSNTN